MRSLIPEAFQSSGGLAVFDGSSKESTLASEKNPSTASLICSAGPTLD